MIAAVAEHTGDKAIVVANDATGANWGLGPLPAREGAFALVGWTMEDADGGIPALAVDALARALVQYGRVTFPCSTLPVTRGTAWHQRGGDCTATQRLKAPSGWRAAAGSLFRSSRLPLISTNHETTARALFDDPFYQWWNLSQFALLSRPAAAPPDLSGLSALPGDLFEDEWTNTLTGLKGTGIEAILRPGVDGDVIGLLCSSPEVRREIEERVGLAAGELGLGFRIVPEEAFALSILTAGVEASESH